MEQTPTPGPANFRVASIPRVMASLPEVYRCGRWMCDRLATPGEQVSVDFLDTDGAPTPSGKCQDCTSGILTP